MRKHICQYLLPWEENNYPEVGSSGYVRKGFGINYSAKHHCKCRVWKFNNLWIHTYSDFDDKFTSEKEAMDSADEALIRVGYKLISDDQVERFEKKLKLLL